MILKECFNCLIDWVYFDSVEEMKLGILEDMLGCDET